MPGCRGSPGWYVPSLPLSRKIIAEILFGKTVATLTMVEVFLTRIVVFLLMILVIVLRAAGEAREGRLASVLGARCWP